MKTNFIKFINTCKLTLLLAAGCGFALPATANYYPDHGDFYYNGLFYLDSYFYWGSAGPWSVSNPGYEHDLWVHDPLFFPSTCVSYTNLPSGYNDCPTAGVLDPSGPVFSFGSFDADSVSNNTWYWGAWTFPAHGFPSTSGFNLQGQENRNVCLGIPTIWCMFSTQTENLLTGLYLVWLGTPTIVFW